METNEAVTNTETQHHPDAVPSKERLVLTLLFWFCCVHSTSYQKVLKNMPWINYWILVLESKAQGMLSRRWRLRCQEKKNWTLSYISLWENKCAVNIKYFQCPWNTVYFKILVNALNATILSKSSKIPIIQGKQAFHRSQKGYWLRTQIQATEVTRLLILTSLFSPVTCHTLNCLGASQTVITCSIAQNFVFCRINW